MTVMRVRDWQAQRRRRQRSLRGRTLDVKYRRQRGDRRHSFALTKNFRSVESSYNSEIFLCHNAPSFS